MKIRCIFCGAWINNPTMGRIMCGKKECKKEYNKERIRIWRKDPEYKKKMKEYRKEYTKRPYVKKKRNIWQKTYFRALYKLRKNHEEEFKEIHKRLKKK